MLTSALLVSAFSMMPGVLMAETSGYWTYSVSSDQVTINSYDGNESHVVIPSSLEGKPVVAIGNAAFSDNSGVQSITIPASVTSIGAMAFGGAGNLNMVIVKGSNPASMGNNVFDSSMISKIYVPADAVDAYKTSWSKYSDLIKADPAGVTFRDNMNMNGLTYRVNDDYTVTLTGCDGGSSDLDINSEAYYDDNGQTSSFQVTAIADGAFESSSIVKVGIPSSIKKIGSRAFNCSSLKEIFVGQEYNSFDPCEIADDAFPGGSTFKIYVPSDKVSDYQQAWSSYANNICALPIGTSVTFGDYDCVYTDYGIYSTRLKVVKYNGNSSEVTVPAYITDKMGSSVQVSDIADEAFANNENIKTVIFPNDYYSGSSPNRLFYGCSNLSKVVIENNMQTLYFGSDCFTGSSSDLVIYVPNDYVSDYRNQLSGYTVKVNPSSINISDANFSYVMNDDMKSVSVNDLLNSSVSELTIPSTVKFTLDGEEREYPVTGIKKLGYSSDLKTLTIPESITSIATNAFSDNNNLNTFKVLGKTPATIGENLFNFSYVTIMIPVGTFDAYKQAWSQYAYCLKEDIAGSAFTVGDYQYKADENYNITLVKYTGSESTLLVPESVEKGGGKYSLSAIDANAFAGNTNLTFVSIPSNITSIGDQAFKGCSVLASVAVACNGAPATLGTDAFAGCAAGLVINVPSAYVDSYKSNWSAYSDKIQASAAGTEFANGELHYKILDNLHSVAIVRYDNYSMSSGELEIPASVEYEGKTYTVSTIAGNAFNNCYNNVVIPASVTKIEDNAFDNCYFSFVKLLGTNTELGSSAFNNYYNLKAILVPEVSYDYYVQNAYMISDKIATEGGETVLSDKEGLSQLARNSYFKAGQLSYHRSFAADAQYATLCLPFDFDPSAAGFEQVYTPMNNIIHFVPASAATGNEEAGQKEKLILMLAKYSGGYISAGTPVFVKLGDNKNINIVSTNDAILNRNNSPMGNSMTVVDWDGTSGLMEQNNNFSINYNGTYENREASSISNLYTFNSDGTFGPQTSGTLSPFRMYLTVYTYSMPMSAYSLSIGVNDGGTTGIRELVTTPAYKVSMSKAIYDLNGRMVSATGSTESLPKGVYIQNHKKIIVE